VRGGRRYTKFGSLVGSTGPDARYVEAAINLFATNDLQLHIEASGLLKLLVHSHHLDEVAINNLIDVMKNPPLMQQYDSSGKLLSQNSGVAGSATAKGNSHDAARSIVNPAASAIELLGELAKPSLDISKRIVKKGVVAELIENLCNTADFGLQRNSSVALFILNQNVHAAATMIRDRMGLSLYQDFIAAPEQIFRHLKGEKLEFLKKSIYNSMKSHEILSFLRDGTERKELSSREYSSSRREQRLKARKKLNKVVHRRICSEMEEEDQKRQ
jgi:hypothetical protein